MLHCGIGNLFVRFETNVNRGDVFLSPNCVFSPRIECEAAILLRLPTPDYRRRELRIAG